MKLLRRLSLVCLAVILTLVSCSQGNAGNEGSDTTNTKGETNMSVIKITNENFEEKVLDSDKPVLLDFYADWCGPCQMLSPILHEIAEEHPEYVIGKINVDEEGELAQRFGIVSIPALFVVKNGEITAQSLGYKPKDAVLALFEQ